MDKKILKLKDSYTGSAALELLKEIVKYDDEDALKLFIDEFSFNLMKERPKELIKLHVSFYLNRGKNDYSLKILNEYQNGPFINLDVEDFMKEFEQEIIRMNNIYSAKAYDDKKLLNDLNSNNDDKIVASIRFLSESNVRKYINQIECVLKDVKLLFSFKILILFILVEQNVDREFIVKNDENETIIFNGAQSKLPFDTDEYKLCRGYIQNLNENDNIKSFAIELINVSLIKLFPGTFIENNDYIYAYCELFIGLAKQLLHMNVDMDYLSNQSGFNNQEIEEFFQKIKTLI